MTTASPGSGGPGSGASAFDSDRIAQIIQQYAEGEKEGYDSASVIRDHTDTMLTWILGLMAAGIVAGHPVLKSVPIAARWAALAPWLVGIAIAVAGRLIAHEIRGRESIWHFEKAITIRSLLLKQRSEDVIEGLSQLINRTADNLKQRHEWSKRYGKLLHRLYYMSHILFVIGLFALAIATAIWN